MRASQLTEVVPQHRQRELDRSVSAGDSDRLRSRPTHWLQIVRLEVDAHLAEFFDAKRRETKSVSPPTLELVEEIEALTMRGGKRLRPAVAAAGYRCVRPGHGMDRLVDLSASLELLQSYLLIHDDWMDGDDVRRGGAAVHASLQHRHEDVHLGAALGILAGDLASTYAWELFVEAPFPMQSWADAQRAFIEIQKQVYCGQQLDLTGDPDVSRMHALKTTSYSVRGPLILGALLGSPTPEQIAALAAWANPIGEAFQIRDDLLGALGDAEATGKPGMDIPHGKLSSVMADLRSTTDLATRQPVESVFGKRNVTSEELSLAQQCLRETGVVERLEQRIGELCDEAREAVGPDLFNPQGLGMLAELADKLTVRRT
ncbi:MAG: polyprenyl synthetase family protein [Myxococcota bacterium]